MRDLGAAILTIVVLGLILYAILGIIIVLGV